MIQFLKAPNANLDTIPDSVMKAAPGELAFAVSQAKASPRTPDDALSFDGVDWDGTFPIHCEGSSRVAVRRIGVMNAYGDVLFTPSGQCALSFVEVDGQYTQSLATTVQASGHASVTVESSTLEQKISFRESSALTMHGGRFAPYGTFSDSQPLFADDASATFRDTQVAGMMTLSGHATLSSSGSAFGGGIVCRDDAQVTLDGAQISNDDTSCQGGDELGIYAAGRCTVTLKNVTVRSKVCIPVVAHENAHVILEGGAFSVESGGDGVVISADGNAVVENHGATINGAVRMKGAKVPAGT